jgi:signal transduction histidine kinase
LSDKGEKSWLLTSKLPLRDQTGKIVGLVGIGRDITALKEAEAKLDQTHKQLLETSRQAGMAEVAVSVLHNVGNVLNSVNVASSCVADILRNSKAANLSKIVALLREHEADLGHFITNDPKGKQLPGYLAQLAGHLAGEQTDALEKLDRLQKNIEHIREIVAMQQNYAKTSGVLESLSVVDLLEDAVRMNAGSMERHNIKMLREYSETPPILVDKHKVLQILVNVISNAKHACKDSGKQDKQIILRVVNENKRIKISVIDNGVGIPEENMTRIFNYGFTTRKDGHGFGLHNGALAAKEMGGSLAAFSEGPERGAAFTLELPIQGQKANL